MEACVVVPVRAEFEKACGILKEGFGPSARRCMIVA